MNLLAKALIETRQYHLSLCIYYEMLTITWIIQEWKMETIIYDKIGLAYYYLNHIDKAKFFHEKSINGDIEPIHETQGTTKTVRDMVIENYDREF